MSYSDQEIALLVDSMTCTQMRYFRSFSIWKEGYVIAPAALLSLQLVVIALISQFIDLWLHHLGQTSVVANIIAGIILGPSLLGRQKEWTLTLFPYESRMTLATMAAFGNMFYHFLIAVKTDPAMILRPKKAAMLIATSSFICTMAFSITISAIFKKYIKMDANLHSSLTPIAISQGFTGISVVYYVISELKLQNTDVGRLSLATAVFSDILNLISVTISFSTNQKVLRNKMVMFWAYFTSFGLVFIILAIIRPVLLNIAAQIPIGRPINQKYIFVVLILALSLGFTSEIIGQHYIFGPTLFGLVVPEGPPLGAALVAKLDTFITSVFYPSYLAMSGLQTNIYKVDFKEIVIVGVLVILAIVVKTITIMLVATMFMHMPPKDGFVLGMVLNSKGILELTIYNFWKDNKILHEAEFTICVMSVIVTTAIITPLVRRLYDPTKQCQPLRRNTIQHMKPDTEFRMQVCIHKPENVPTIVNLLEVSNATMDSPIAVLAMVLVKLVGRNAPLLLSNDYKNPQQNEAIAATKIANALRQYEQNNLGCTNVQSFTSISEYHTMHIDIFGLAVDRRTTMLIMPFHKQWAIDGTIESTHPSIRRMNMNILQKAPCSVGILIDRGILTGSLNIMNSLKKFKVAVIFIGSNDDAEALAYGARMVKHGKVILTVIRFLVFGDENSIERKRETELIFQYKQANLGNGRYIYVEEAIKDGVGLSQCIGKIASYFDLILVGRFHQKSALFMGLEDWRECPELGFIGDMLASPDMKTNASILVIQQQRMRPSRKESRVQIFPDDSEWSQVS